VLGQRPPDPGEGGSGGRAWDSLWVGVVAEGPARERGSRLVVAATPEGQRPQVVEGVVRPARFERATYRFVARADQVPRPPLGRTKHNKGRRIGTDGKG